MHWEGHEKWSVPRLHQYKQERRYEIRRASTLVGGETKYQNVYDQRD